MKKISYLALILVLRMVSMAQDVPFERAAFPGKKEEFRDALRKYDIGADFYSQGRKEFDDFRKSYLLSHKYLPVSVYDYQRAGYSFFRNALSPLTDASRFNPNNAMLNYMLGFIWFQTEPSNPQTLKYFESSYALAPEVKDSDVLYWLAWTYQLQGKWDEAIKHYQLQIGKLQLKAKSNLAAIEDIRKKIAECELGKKLAASPERVFVDNLGPNINSAYPEYGPAISTDEETILFTARRPNSVGGKKDEADGGYYEDVYSSVKLNGKWQPAKQLSRNVNTENHDAAAGLSPDGSKLYVYRHSGSDGGDLYESVLFGLDWEPPVHMNKNINTRYHESSVSLSFDGKRMYFVSDKESGLGDRDIYYSDIDLNGEWGPAKNLGPEINTRYGEEAVFIHPDGITMYFSSKGHETMGGYDIFKSVFENGKWQKPVNLGYPINGPDDDVFFVISGSGNRAYFASSKPGGMGEKDLYKITFLGPEKPPILSSEDQLLANSNPFSNLKTEGQIEVKSARLTILKGSVLDEKTAKPLEANIELIDNEKNVVLATFKSNKITGKYLVTLPSGKNYGLSVKSPGYLFHSENFDLPEAAEFQEFNIDILLKNMEVGKTVVLKNIFFDFDKADIKAESANELDRLVKLLRENPGLKIELGSHTDDLGTSEYNEKLSDNRSRSVVQYLIGKGISGGRLQAKGYGESMPIKPNNSEDNRRQNRRTEFKIISR